MQQAGLWNNPAGSQSAMCPNIDNLQRLARVSPCVSAWTRVPGSMSGVHRTGFESTAHSSGQAARHSLLKRIARRGRGRFPAREMKCKAGPGAGLRDRAHVSLSATEYRLVHH